VAPAASNNNADVDGRICPLKLYRLLLHNSVFFGWYLRVWYAFLYYWTIVYWYGTCR